MKPVIFGFKSFYLSQEEIEFFKEVKPYGFIIFSRNCESSEQIKQLTSQLKSISERDNCPILIDQEGGRIQRIKPPISSKNYPTAEFFGKIAESNLDLAKKTTYESNKHLASELFSLGINVNCTPCTDLYYDFANKIIGDRSFGSNKFVVSELAKSVISAHNDSLVDTVIKHIPGHGRANLDSHLELPRISDSLTDLDKTDFDVFRILSNLTKYAMTGHIIFDALDPNECVTYSKKSIDFIRKEIGYTGLLMTDCLTMKALRGNFTYKALKSLEAGCNLLLHCSGDMDEMIEICDAIRDVNILEEKEI